MQKNIVNVQKTVSPNLAEVQNIISEITGYDPDDIKPSFNLEEDLQLNMDTNFVLIIKRANAHFGTHLDAKQLRDEVETVGDVVDLIDEETELG